LVYKVYLYKYPQKLAINQHNIIAYKIFFLFICLVCFGSSYYHLLPNNYRLLWDRLPITVGFMALMSIVVSEKINTNLGRKLLIPFILIGIIALGHWYYTDLQTKGHGDLRAYLLVQLLPIVLLPTILWRFKSGYNTNIGYYSIFVYYILAKFAKLFDKQIFELSFHTISGHSIKHVLVAIGIYALLKSYNQSKFKNTY
jgi:hypothetical protein